MLDVSFNAYFELLESDAFGVAQISDEPSRWHWFEICVTAPPGAFPAFAGCSWVCLLGAALVWAKQVPQSANDNAAAIAKHFIFASSKLSTFKSSLRERFHDATDIARSGCMRSPGPLRPQRIFSSKCSRARESFRH